MGSKATALELDSSVLLADDDESGRHTDSEKWLEEVYSRLHPAPHVLISHCRPRGWLRNRTGQACLRQAPVLNSVQEQRRRPLKRHGPPSEAVVAAVTNGRLDGSTEAPPEPVEGPAEVFGSWERFF